MKKSHDLIIIRSILYTDARVQSLESLYYGTHGMFITYETNVLDLFEIIYA